MNDTIYLDLIVTFYERHYLDLIVTFINDTMNDTI